MLENFAYREKKTIFVIQKQLKITIMKKFKITLKNLNNGLILHISTDGSNISEALHKTEALCKEFEKNGIMLDITMIYETDKD